MITYGIADAHCKQVIVLQNYILDVLRLVTRCVGVANLPQL